MFNFLSFFNMQKFLENVGAIVNVSNFLCSSLTEMLLGQIKTSMYMDMNASCHTTLCVLAFTDYELTKYYTDLTTELPYIFF
jgi:uncharacterized membrane protein